MRVYKITIPKAASPVGVVINHGKVTQAHPSVGIKEGSSIEKFKERVKKKRWNIVKVHPAKGSKKRRK